MVQKRIDEYQQGAHAAKWEGCKAFKSYQAMIQSTQKPEGVILGVPPAVHGKTLQGMQFSLVWPSGFFTTLHLCRLLGQPCQGYGT